MHVLRYFFTKKIRVPNFCLDHASFRLLSPTEYFIDVYLTNTIEENKSLALFLWVMTGVPSVRNPENISKFTLPIFSQNLHKRNQASSPTKLILGIR